MQHGKPTRNIQTQIVQFINAITLSSDSIDIVSNITTARSAENFQVH